MRTTAKALGMCLVSAVATCAACAPTTQPQPAPSRTTLSQSPSPSGSSPNTSAQDAASSTLARGGRVTFVGQDGKVYWAEARPNAKPHPLAADLDALSKGKDRVVNIASDGSVFLLDTSRFGCEAWSCLALVQPDLSEGHAVRSRGALIHSDGPAAVGPNGEVIVYSDKPDADKPDADRPDADRPDADRPDADRPDANEAKATHGRDLLALRRKGKAYENPSVLSASSPFAFNAQPSLSRDGRRIVFDCGPEPYGADGTAVCEVGIDGTGFRIVIEPGKPGWTKKVRSFHHPSYAPDGSIVVEADRPPSGERIWRVPAHGGNPTPIGEAFGNDNSPCVMPDGRVVSLWLGRAEGNGHHEIKVMSPDGKDYFMAVVGREVKDVVLGCAQ